jgi:glycosyltransferase involved in cell wall biosynthesis
MIMRSPRIMYLCPCWPHDKSHGGQLRALQIGRALQQIGQPTLVVAGAHDVDPEVKAKSAAEFTLGREMKVLTAPVRGVSARLGAALDRDFTNIHGLVIGADNEAWFIEAQKQFDLTWFFKLRTANFFTNARWHRSVVDIDDLPSSMERSQLRESRGLGVWLKTWYRMIKLHRHEHHLSHRFDVLAICSEADRATLGGRAPVHIIPNGFARPLEVLLRKPSEPPRIGFMGLYSYLPNLEGIRWFIERCWRQIKEEIPGVRLRLVGQDTSGPLKPNDPSVDGLGWIENPAAEVASWSLMIVPIRIGAGTRVKIADAFSRKCPLVSTRFGALGYDVQHGRELLLADDPEAFATACISLIRDPATANAMAERAFDAFLEKWTWDAIAPRVWAAAEDCLRRNFGCSC